MSLMPCFRASKASIPRLSSISPYIVGSTPRGPRSRKTHAYGMFQVGDGLRYRRLGDAQMGCGFRHAAELHDCRQHIQIAQVQESTDAALPIGG